MLSPKSSLLIVALLFLQSAEAQVEFSIVRLPSQSNDSVTLSFRSTAFRNIKAIGFEILPNDANIIATFSASLIEGSDIMNFPQKIRLSKTENSLKVFLIKRKNVPSMYSRGGEILRMTISNSVTFSATLKNWNVMVLDSSNQPVPATFSDTILKTEQTNQLRYSLRYYPNPVSNFLSIEAEDREGMNLQLFDILGRSLIQQEVMPSGTQSQRYQFSMASLIPGVYFLKVGRRNQPDQILKLLKIR